MLKVLTIFGTRPEAIKLAPVLVELRKCKHIESRVCVTAQHRQMLDQVLDIFNIVPEIDLNIMKKDQDLFDITSNVLLGLREILRGEKPDIVLVQGDTTTAMTTALAAYYLQIPIGHVEAGLRTYDKYSPFPEEKNRHILGVLADYHFAPTEWSRSNLEKEGVSADSIWVTGNTVVDALFMTLEKQESVEVKEVILRCLMEKYSLNMSTNRRSVLVTGHRRESFGDGFKNICLALKEIANSEPNMDIIYPVHLNPNVQKPVNEILSSGENIHLIEPLEYELFVFLMNNSYLVLTDSGGIQEEAPSLGKPVLIMRNKTERPEGVEAGVVKLVGVDKNNIVSETMKLLRNNAFYKKMSKAVNPYGDGKAASRIAKVIASINKL